MRSIYKRTEHGWEHVQNAYNGSSDDASLEYECYLLNQRTDDEYRVLDEREAVRLNRKRRAA